MTHVEDSKALRPATGRAQGAACRLCPSHDGGVRLGPIPRGPGTGRRRRLSPLPKLIRFVSQEGETKGRICYGKVETTDGDGVPTAVRHLQVEGRSLCDPTDPAPGTPLPEPPGAYVDRLVAAVAQLPDAASGPSEPITNQRHIQAPVRADQAWLEDGRIVVAAVGINYALHAEETRKTEAVAFNKFAEPGGPYQDVRKVERLPPNTGMPVCLLDHEVEIAFVALEKIPLDPLPPLAELRRMIAFFAINNVSDREPIILDDARGYTRGKGRPGFLPAGPWLVPGTDLLPETNEGGSEPVTSELTVRHDGVAKLWQHASSTDMMLGPGAILAELGSRNPQACAAGKVCSMPDAAGVERFIVPGDVLPAGSSVLTGTPGGTAIKDPTLLQKLTLFIRGGFSRGGGRHKFLADQIEDATGLGYLQVGDTVDQVITGLGRQEWSVVRHDDLKQAGSRLGERPLGLLGIACPEAGSDPRHCTPCESLPRGVPLAVARSSKKAQRRP